MKIALLAPLWEPVPPVGYGGTELMVYELCEEYARRGLDVTLFACSQSKTSAKLEPLTNFPMRTADIKNPVLKELIAVSKLLECHKKFDIIHNHLGFILFPFVNLITTPVLTTLHGAFVVKEEIEYCSHFKHLPFVSISESQRVGCSHLNYISTVYNGIEVERYTFKEYPQSKDPYLLFLGRLSEEKAPHLAIKLAKKTGYKLILAGKVDVVDRQYYEDKVKHLIDGKQILYIGEVGHKQKCKLFKNAIATVHPVVWPEPFGLVLIESMACGTPVLALNKGSIPEVVKDNVTGYVEDKIENLIKRVKDIDKIDRIACRQHVNNNFSSKKMADGYLDAYRKILNTAPVSIEKGLEVLGKKSKKKLENQLTGQLKI